MSKNKKITIRRSRTILYGKEVVGEIIEGSPNYLLLFADLPHLEWGIYSHWYLSSLNEYVKRPPGKYENGLEKRTEVSKMFPFKDITRENIKNYVEDCAITSYISAHNMEDFANRDLIKRNLHSGKYTIDTLNDAVYKAIRLKNTMPKNAKIYFNVTPYLGRKLKIEATIDYEVK